MASPLLGTGSAGELHWLTGILDEKEESWALPPTTWIPLWGKGPLGKLSRHLLNSLKIENATPEFLVGARTVKGVDELGASCQPLCGEGVLRAPDTSLIPLKPPHPPPGGRSSILSHSVPFCRRCGPNQHQLVQEEEETKVTLGRGEGGGTGSLRPSFPKSLTVLGACPRPVLAKRRGEGRKAGVGGGELAPEGPQGQGPPQLVETFQLEKEWLELEPPPQADLDLEPEPEPKPEPELEGEPEPKDSEQEEPRIESPQCHTQQDASQWIMRSASSYLSEAEDDQASANRRSIRVQTSKHLFWADKLIQTSEHSLQRVLHRQPRKNTGKTSGCQDRQCVPGDAMCSKKQLQNSGAQPAPPATDSRQPPNPHPSSSSLSPGIGLADVVNFASSLAVASSSKRDLPSLEHRIRAPPQKPEAPSTDPAARRATDQPEGKNLSKELLEKPLRAGESQKAWKQEDKNFLHPYLDFSKPGMKRATIEGQVKLLQQPARSPPPQGAVKE